MVKDVKSVSDVKRSRVVERFEIEKGKRGVLELAHNCVLKAMKM